MTQPNGVALGGGVGSLATAATLPVVTGSPIHQIVTPTLNTTLSIPVPVNAYLVLRVYFMLRVDSGGGMTFALQFNGDTGLNYSYQNSYGAGASPAASSGSSTSLPIIGYVPGSTSPAGLFCSGEIIIPQPSLAGILKSFQAFCGGQASNASIRNYTASGYWNNTVPITSIQFPTNNPAANFVAGSFIELSFA